MPPPPLRAPMGIPKLCCVQVLLPYMVRDVLTHGTAADLDPVVREVQCVLGDASVRRDAGADARAGGAGLQHRAVQTVFTLFDTLRDWRAGSGGAAGVAGGGVDPLGAPFQRLFDAIPLAVLAKGAFRIQAYTRALMCGRRAVCTPVRVPHAAHVYSDSCAGTLSQRRGD